MALHTVADVFADFSLSYQGVLDDLKITLFNRVDIEIIRAFGFKKRQLNIPLVAGENAYPLDARAVWIEKARYVDQPNGDTQGLGGWMLQETNVDELDTEPMDWRASPNQTPCIAMMTADAAGISQIAFESPSIASTLLVTGATFATPVVITSSAPHNLSNSNRADIVDVLGNTAANGHWYAQVIDAYNFALFQDSSLTIPVIGNALWDNGGLISCAGSPYLQVFTRWHDELTIDDDMPDAPVYVDLWANGMRYYYAWKRVLQDVPAYEKSYLQVIQKQMEITQKRGGRKPFRIRTVGVRARSHVRRRGCGYEDAGDRQNAVLYGDY